MALAPLPIPVLAGMGAQGASGGQGGASSAAGAAAPVVVYSYTRLEVEGRQLASVVNRSTTDQARRLGMNS